MAKPEELPGRYDIVFAKAMAAMEAMAVGTAVVLCDYAGLGPMVSSATFDALRLMNFGFEALAAPISAHALVQEIRRYDPVGAARVRDRVRAETSLPGAVERLIGLYRDVYAMATTARPRAPISPLNIQEASASVPVRARLPGATEGGATVHSSSRRYPAMPADSAR